MSEEKIPAPEDKVNLNPSTANSYWQKLSSLIAKQKEKQAQTPDQQRFEKINRKLIALHYVLTFIHCPIPPKIYLPFRKICIEIGREKGRTLKKDEASHDWTPSKEVRSLSEEKAAELDQKLGVLLEKIKENDFLIHRMQDESVFLNIALQLEYDAWLEPVADLFETLGIVGCAADVVKIVTEFKANKNQKNVEPVPAEPTFLSDVQEAHTRKRKHKKSKKNKKNKKNKKKARQHRP